MSTDKSIFENSQATPESSPDTSGNQEPAFNNNQFSDLLSGIRNEQGQQKYSSVEEALKGGAHAQNFIKQLQEENASLKASLSKSDELQSKYSEIEKTVQTLMSQKNEESQPASLLLVKTIFPR